MARHFQLSNVTDLYMHRYCGHQNPGDSDKICTLDMHKSNLLLSIKANICHALAYCPWHLHTDLESSETFRLIVRSINGLTIYCV